MQQKGPPPSVVQPNVGRPLDLAVWYLNCQGFGCTPAFYATRRPGTKSSALRIVRAPEVYRKVWIVTKSRRLGGSLVLKCRDMIECCWSFQTNTQISVLENRGTVQSLEGPATRFSAF